MCLNNLNSVFNEGCKVNKRGYQLTYWMCVFFYIHHKFVNMYVPDITMLNIFISKRN